MSTYKAKAALAIEGDRDAEGQAAFTNIARSVMASKGIAKRPLAWSSAFSAVRCPDQWVGSVRFDAGRFHYTSVGAEPLDQFAWRRPIGELDPDGPRRLIMILESPHTDEFGWNRRRAKPEPVEAPRETFAIGPAAGLTGKNIRALLASINLSGIKELASASVGDTFDLVLINAVQYQTSLGHPTHLFRDVAFRLAWNSPQIGCADFQARMAALWRAQPQDVVMNCCTGGEGSKLSLKRQVYDALRDLSDKDSTLSPFVVGCAHPSSWRRNKLNREAKVIGLRSHQGLSSRGGHV